MRPLIAALLLLLALPVGNPLEIIGVVSGGTRRAKRTLRTVRLYIEQCPLLRHLRPDETCLDASDQFVTPQANGKLGSAVSFSSYGISSNMSGQRFNVAVLDDVEVKRDRSPAAQENLDLLTSEIQNILNPDGRVIALGTPQVASLSIYARWNAQDEWKVYRALLFEELPVDEGVKKRPQLISRWPARWTDAALTKKRRSLPAREWDLHWRIDLSVLDADDRPLKLRDFITVKHDPHASSFPTVIRAGGNKLEHLETGVADADGWWGSSESCSDSGGPISTRGLSKQPLERERPLNGDGDGNSRDGVTAERPGGRTIRDRRPRSSRSKGCLLMSGALCAAQMLDFSRFRAGTKRLPVAVL